MNESYHERGFKVDVSSLEGSLTEILPDITGEAVQFDREIDPYSGVERFSYDSLPKGALSLALRG